MGALFILEEQEMKIVFLDAATIGDDLTYECFCEIGEVVVYPTTKEEEFEKTWKEYL